MRDPRFLAAGTEKFEEPIRARVQALLQLTDGRDQLVAVLHGWWRETLALKLTKDAAYDELRRRVAAAPGPGQLSAMACDALDRGGDDAERRVGAQFLGEAAGIVLREAGGGIEDLDLVVGVLEDCWRAVEILIDQLDTAPRWLTATALRASIPTELGNLVRADHFSLISNDRLASDEVRARKRGLPYYLWGRRENDVLLAYPIYVRLALLARRDYGEVAAAAEALPVHDLRSALWRSLHLHEDRSAILSLLKAAPSVFQGSSWTGHVVALDAIESAVTHARMLRQQARWQADPVSALEQSELPEWFRSVTKVVGDRPDGRRLLLLVAAWLVGEMLRSPFGGPQWSPIDLIIAAMLPLLTTAPSLKEMEELVELTPINDETATPISDETTKRDQATYLVTGAVLGGDSAAFWSWYRRLLSANDDSLCWHARTWRRAACYDALAEKLVGLSTPVEEWRAAWNSLFVTDREAARFDRTSQIRFLPSAHLLRVGFALLRLAPGKANAQLFYSELRRAVRIIVSSDVGSAGPLGQWFPAEGLELAVTVLGRNWAGSINDERAILTSPVAQLGAASLLIEGGASFSQADAALKLSPNGLVGLLESLKKERDGDQTLRGHWDKVMRAHQNEAGTAP